jgi:hypothetical protein
LAEFNKKVCQGLTGGGFGYDSDLVGRELSMGVEDFYFLRSFFCINS